MSKVPSERKLLDIAASGDVEALQKLVEQEGDDLNLAYQDGEGISALMKAAEAGHPDMVIALLEAGCPWNLLDKDGYCAGQYGGRHKDVVELLLEWGVQAERVLGALERERRAEASSKEGGARDAANAAYLKQKLVYEDDKLLDAEGEAVMMGWEKPLMDKHAELICAKGGDVLNIGFGLGLVDKAIQSHKPRTHTIIEAHPDVYAHAVKQGWKDRPGVRLIHGRWQDVLPQLETYDGIFFDTYGEYFEEMQEFHAELPKLLKPGGCYSFFNGLAPDNLFFHMVYGRLVQMELEELGITTQYHQVNIKEALEEKVWEGVRNKYWRFSTYFLPECYNVGLAEEGEGEEEEEGEDGAGPGDA